MPALCTRRAARAPTTRKALGAPRSGRAEAWHALPAVGAQNARLASLDGRFPDDPELSRRLLPA